MANAKKLVLTEPPIISRLDITYPLAILLNYEECLPWFYSNYIQVKCYKEVTSPETLNFYICIPDCMAHLNYSKNYVWLDQQSIYLKAFKRCNINLIDFIQDSIDDDCYIYAYFDEYYIPNKHAYQNYHNKHDILIYGYDDNTKSFDVVGYDGNFNYVQAKVSFDDIQTAHDNTPFYEKLILLKKRKDVKYEFDISLVTEQLDEYLNSKDYSKKFSSYIKPDEKYVYGFQVYESVKKYLYSIIETKEHPDLRTFRMLYEHKVIMLNRIKYIQDNNISSSLEQIYDEYSVVVDLALKLFKVIRKYFAIKDEVIINRSISLLDELANKEYDILSALLQKLSGNLP